MTKFFISVHTPLHARTGSTTSPVHARIRLVCMHKKDCAQPCMHRARRVSAHDRSMNLVGAI